MERWRKKLVDAYVLNEEKEKKFTQLEEIQEQKSQTVMEMHKKRQEDTKRKNELALARVRDNESKLVQQRH